MSCNHTNRIGHFQDALDPLSLDASFALEDLHQFRHEVVHLGEELGLKGFGRDSQELCIYLKKKKRKCACLLLVLPLISGSTAIAKYK